ncbi:MAG: hypothetical protein L3J41_10290 [Melioribacteraceae bacterium]|nr:hypothetical protein [Melioribacteraceae bacterium]
MRKLLFILFALSLSSCFEDVVDSVEVRFSNSADLITYTETRTTFFEGEDIPQLVTVDELNQSLGDYHIIDIRDEFDFRAGHVIGANNVEMKDVLSYLKENNLSQFQKIIIISNTGQLASYTSSLLIIGGYEKTYTLNGGMTYWNQVFSDELRDVIGNNILYTRRNRASQPSEKTNPPDLYYESNPKTIEAKIEERIQVLLNEPRENIFISAKKLDALYSRRQRRYIGTFVVFAQPERLLPTLRGNEERWIDGPIRSYFYDTPIDFTSNSALLTLPPNLDIVLYSDNGQQSAFITAYLKMLGYSAKTVKYGKITMMCFNIREIYDTSKYGNPLAVVGYDTLFCTDIEQDMRDYPYVVVGD